MKIFFGGGFPLVETELLINNSRLHIARKREALSTAIITSPLLDVAANLSWFRAIGISLIRVVGRM